MSGMAGMESTKRREMHNRSNCQLSVDVFQDSERLRTIVERRRRAKRKKRHIALVLILTSIFGALSLLCTAYALSEKQTTKDYDTEVVTKGVLTETISASGALSLKNRSTVLPGVSGTVAEVFVSEGDVVAEADVLFRVWNTDFENMVAYSSEAMQYAETVRDDVFRRLEASRIEYDKEAEEYKLGVEEYKTLYESYQISPEESEMPTPPYEGDMQNAYAKMTALETQYETCKQAADQARLSYNSASRKLDSCTVTASTDGTIVSLSVAKGDAVVAATTSAAEIADTSSLCIELSVGELDIAALSVGQIVNARVDALSEEHSIRGSIASVSNMPLHVLESSADQSAVYVATVELAEPLSENVKPGMAITGEIVIQEFADSLLVSRQAVVEDEGSSYVYILDEITGIPEKVWVEIIGRSGDVIAVEGDIAEGSKVITDPQAVR